MDLDKKVSEAVPKSGIEFSRTADFINLYANNVFLESSLWDLKLVFGHTDQQVGLNAIIQNAAVTLPWSQVKMLVYFLQSHVAAHETQNGRIIISDSLIPPVPDEPNPELLQQGTHMRDVHKVLKENYEAFIASNPEAAPAGKSTKLRKQ